MRWAIIALLLLLVAKDARAAPEEPIGDGRFGHVRVGFGGFVPRRGVTPVTVLLVNPDGREHVIRVAVSPVGAQRAEATVVLAPRATGRASFVLPAPNGVAVSLSEGPTLLASSGHATHFLAARVDLEVDGSPQTRAAGSLLASAPPAVGCRVEDLPAEAACYAPFRVVTLRLVDPRRIEAGALAALRDFVRAGGTVVVSGAGKDAGFFDSLEEAAEPGAVLTKRHGLGRVALVASDLGAITSAAEVDRDALALPCAPSTRLLFSPVCLAFQENEALKGPGLTYAVFLFTYALVGAPVIALVLRGVRRRRLAWALAAGIVVSFVLAGAIVAASTRNGRGRVTALSYVLAPARGDAVVLAEAVLASGGSTRPDVSVEGDALAVTTVGRTHGYNEYEETVVTTRSAGHGRVALPAFPVPNFGIGNMVILAAAPRVRAIEAWVERTSEGGRLLVVKNDTDRDLGPSLLNDGIGCDEFQHAAFTSVRAGTTATAPITSADPAVHRTLVERTKGLRGTALASRLISSLDPVPRRYTLMTLDTPPIRVRASNSDVDEICFRIQAVRDPDGPKGWIGADLALSREGALTVASVVSGSPAAVAGIQPGWRICSLGNREVSTPEEVAQVLGIVGPGGHLSIELGDANNVWELTVDVLCEPVHVWVRGAHPGPQ